MISTTNFLNKCLGGNSEVLAVSRTIHSTGWNGEIQTPYLIFTVRGLEEWGGKKMGLFEHFNIWFNISPLPVKGYFAVSSPLVRNTELDTYTIFYYEDKDLQQKFANYCWHLYKARAKKKNYLAWYFTQQEIASLDGLFGSLAKENQEIALAIITSTIKEKRKR